MKLAAITEFQIITLRSYARKIYVVQNGPWKRALRLHLAAAIIR